MLLLLTHCPSLWCVFAQGTVGWSKCVGFGLAHRGAGWQPALQRAAAASGGVRVAKVRTYWTAAAAVAPHIPLQRRASVRFAACEAKLRYTATAWPRSADSIAAHAVWSAKAASSSLPICGALPARKHLRK